MRPQKKKKKKEKKTKKKKKTPFIYVKNNNIHLQCKN